VDDSAPVIDGDLLDALLGHLVPADEHGPDAATIGLPAFVRARLAGVRRAVASTYASGLRDLDARTRETFGIGFAEASAAQRDVILADVERAEAELPPWERPAAFLETVLGDVRQGMFGDPAYGGNRGGAGWDLIGYPDPRRVWTERDQRLDVVVIPLSPRAARPPAARPVAARPVADRPVADRPVADARPGGAR